MSVAAFAPANGEVYDAGGSPSPCAASAACPNRLNAEGTLARGLHAVER